MHEIPQNIIDRMCILNPMMVGADIRYMIRILYKPLPANVDVGWLPLCQIMNIPRMHVKDWYTTAQNGLDVTPAIDHYLNMIGVTDEVLKMYTDSNIH
jgi:hypothetical protein